MKLFLHRRSSPDMTRTDSRLIRRYRRPISPVWRIVGGLGLMIIIGTILLMLPGVGSNRRLTLIEALFTATSALSVTGLSIINPGQDLTIVGKIILLILIQVGGVGFMMIAVVTFRLLGRKVGLIDRLALCDSLGLIRPGAILELTRSVLQAVFLFEGTGAIILWLHWYHQLGEHAWFFAIFHAVSAFCNAGFDLFGALPDQYPSGIPNDSFSLLVLGSLIFLGGLGIPVFGNLFSWKTERRLSLHTRITLVVVISLIIIGTIGIFLAEWFSSEGAMQSEPWYRQLLLSVFQSVSARTAGFAGIQPFDQITPASQLVLILLMFIGAAPASMGGGITTGTFAVLTLSIWAYAKNLPAVQVGGRSVGEITVRKAAAVLTISLFLVTLATWLILISHETTLSIALFEVVSAFATCGLSLNFTSELNLFGELIIVLMMFWGRLGAITIVVAIAQQQPVKLVGYPEEQILIG